MGKNLVTTSYSLHPPIFDETEPRKVCHLSGLPLVMFVGRLELDLGIQLGGVAGVACAGGEGVVGPD